jgi:hypothetical protein
VASECDEVGGYVEIEGGNEGPTLGPELGEPVSGLSISSMDYAANFAVVADNQLYI